MRNVRASSFRDFKCGNCGALVSNVHILSGVNNRNHCPYCLWSCHLDLYSSGDRLSACKGKMKPIGLTMKKSRNRYQLSPRGELMLIHFCTECEAVSINRIAADDDAQSVIDIFHVSANIRRHEFYEQHGINLLNSESAEIVYTQLYGSAVEAANM
jgi:hypothetical protein